MKKLSSLIFFFLFTITFSQNREANDCVNYIQICGNQTITLNPNGYGVQELNLSNVCQSTENNSLWLKFTVRTTGTLGFDLIPTSSGRNVDYDFWIFGPNATCGSLGSSIRCSTTNPSAAGLPNNHTGMRDSEPAGDFFEGPGPDGDGYIKSLDVVAGESYFLVIDRPQGNGSFSLNWTGTAILEDPFGTVSNAFGTVAQIDLCSTTKIYDFSAYSASILNSNPDFDITFYKTYEDATYDENRITKPITLDNHNYYYRIQSTVTECFRVETIKVNWKPLPLFTPTLKRCQLSNNTATFDLTLAQLSNESLVDTKYYETLQKAQDHLPGTEIFAPDAYSSIEKSVFAWVRSSSGCESSTEIILSFYPTPNVDINLYDGNLCDNDLNGSISLKFSDITPVIVKNPGDFEIYYYLVTNPGIALTNDFILTQNTSIRVEVRSKNGCAPVFGTLNFKIAPQIALNPVAPIQICDSDRSGSEIVDLQDYANLFTTTATPFVYEFLDDAKKDINRISFSQELKANKSFFFRFENNTDCPAVGELKLSFKSPKIADLEDVVICKENDITLDAGPNFDKYLWSSGSASSSSGKLKVGNHWVDLTFENCTTRQLIKVIAEEEVIIKVLEIANDKLTVTVSGGTAPYEYSLDGTTWQASNVFNNLPKGIQQVFARSAKKCMPTMREFSNINLISLITPNGDGKNDVLDYSSLRFKENVIFKIFDRYGKSVFVAKNNNFIWDGKDGGRVLPTDTYWYSMEWTEPDTGILKKYNSWILLKNR